MLLSILNLTAYLHISRDSVAAPDEVCLVCMALGSTLTSVWCEDRPEVVGQKGAGLEAKPSAPDSVLGFFFLLPD